MPAPKSVIKVKQKNGNVNVEYTSNVDAAKYYLFELSRAALRDVGKYMTKIYRNDLYNTFRKITGMAGKGVKYKVWSSKNTKYPRVQIGIVPGVQYYGPFEELGSSKTPKHGILTKGVESNVAEIVKIESQYLSGLEGAAAELDAIIDESEIEGGSDEN